MGDLDGDDNDDLAVAVQGSISIALLLGDGNGAFSADDLDGGGANDRLVGGAGDDQLDGGGGSDLADYSGRTSSVTASIGDGPGDGEAGENDSIGADVERLRGGDGDCEA